MRQSGLSLIEVLIIMATISVLYALMMPVMAAFRQRAAREIKTQQLRQLSAATLIYYSDNDSRLPPADMVGGIEWHRLVLNGSSRQEAASLRNPDKEDDSSVFPGFQSLGYSLNQCLSAGRFGAQRYSTEFNPLLIVQAAELKHKGQARAFTLTYELPCHDRVYAELHSMEPSGGRFLADSDQGGSAAARFDGSIKWSPYGFFRSKGCACTFPGSEPETPFQTFPR